MEEKFFREIDDERAQEQLRKVIAEEWQAERMQIEQGLRRAAENRAMRRQRERAERKKAKKRVSA